MDWVLIKLKYPKSFMTLTKWLSLQYDSFDIWSEPSKLGELENDLCFLYPFFDLMGLFIVPTFTHITSATVTGNFGFDITDYRHRYWRRRNFTTRYVAQLNSFIRAFELLEQKIRTQ